VLVADDSAVFLAGMVRAIAASPVLELVGQASDGDEALAAIVSLVPDVALLDVNMPGLDGIAIAERVGGSSRCVLISGAVDELMAARARSAGAADCLDKALTRRQICSVLIGVGGGAGG
jgi:DNA-binding NarL/FixJ family response regulator